MKKIATRLPLMGPIVEPLVFKVYFERLCHAPTASHLQAITIA